MSASPIETWGMRRLPGVVHTHASLDRDHVGGALEGGRRRLPGFARPADGLEEVLEPGWGDHPEHDQVLVGTLVDQLVLDVVAEEARGARHQRMAYSVHHRAPAAAEADLQLDLVAVRVLAHAAARGDGLKTHGGAGEAGGGGGEGGGGGRCGRGRASGRGGHWRERAASTTARPPAASPRRARARYRSGSGSCRSSWIGT